MNLFKTLLTIAGVMTALSPLAASADLKDDGHKNRWRSEQNVQLGPRPFFLVEDMEKSELKSALQQCSEDPFYKTDFSIGHRGAALQFPEHTQRIRIDCVSKANHNLIRLLDEPGGNRGA